MHRTGRPRRRLAIVVSAAIVFTANACHFAASTGFEPVSSGLTPFPIADRERDWMLLQRRPSLDTAEHVIGEMHTAGHALTDDPTRIAIVQHWVSPYDVSDSLVVARGTLHPQDEVSQSANLRFHYRYDGSRVTGAIQHGDSAPRSISRNFGETVYAFNEVDELVRSLRYRIGLSLVVPLFSEADADLEHDTLTVLRDTTTRDGMRAWIVRFADPVIVTRYLVDAHSREIVEMETRQRKSGILFRLEPVNRAPVLVTPSLREETTRFRLEPEGRTQPDTTAWSVERRFVTEAGRRMALQVMVGRTTVDSVLFDPSTLVPSWEHSHGSRAQNVAFSPTRITGQVSTGGSPARSIDVAIPGFAYSSTMDDLVVRSLPFTPEYCVALAFWNGDHVEIDTVRVRSQRATHKTVGDKTAWVVDFVEPYSTETMWIERASRRVIRHVYTWRDGRRSVLVVH